MLAPNSSASGPPVAKRGGGSSATVVSRVVVAGDAQATTDTSSANAQTCCRARSVIAVRFSLMTGSLKARESIRIVHPEYDDTSDLRCPMLSQTLLSYA